VNKGATIQVPVSGQVSGIEESEMLEEVGNSKQFAAGKFADKFEKEYAAFMGYKHALFTNSGSSANLLMITAQKWAGPVRVSGCSFPTTINPIIQTNNAPYFVDIELGTYLPKGEVDIGCHFLGNWCKSGKIIDSCDGAFPGADDRTMTSSFFPAHFMTTGEGGMVLTNDTREFMHMRSLRDWGRDCWCAPGNDNTCGKRFEHVIDGVEYDHKYIYSNIGYNLKNTEMAAAIGLAQLKKLPDFLDKRRRNFNHLYYGGSFWMDKYFIMPKSVKDNTAWFGFPLTIREDAPFTRKEITQYLDSVGVGNRVMFGGNITRQPAYKDVDYDADPLTNCDIVMQRGFWIGCWHGLELHQLDYTLERIQEFVNRY